MNYYLKYGRGKIKININGGRLLGFLRKKEFYPDKQQKEIILETLGKKIKSFIRKNDKIGIVIPDDTRKAGVKIYLPIIIKELLKAGISKNNIIIFIASGAHKPMDKMKVNNLIPYKINKSFKIICNNAFVSKNFYLGGITKRGTKIWINKEIKKVDKLIATSSVLYHYFAGYGGGPKILIPGLAGYESIAGNHKLTLTKKGKFNNKCRNGNISDNPVYLDIAEAVSRFFRKSSVLYLGTVLNEKGEIIKAFCGDIIEEHKKAAKFLDGIYKIKIKQKADAVICSAGGYPKDINLIQSHKSIHNAYAAVKKNGTIICFAECGEGIGSKTFLKFFNYNNIADLKKNILKEYSLNAQTALSFWNKLLNATIILITKLDKKKVRQLERKGLQVSGKYREAEKYLNSLKAKHPTYYIIPEANSLQIVL